MSASSNQASRRIADEIVIDVTPPELEPNR